jgi:hypothetical protein
MKSLMRSILFGLLLNVVAIAASAQPNPRHSPDWERIVEAAKKEGKVVVSISASSELRAVIETHFEKRFDVDVEPVVATASAIVARTCCGFGARAFRPIDNY